MSLLERWWKRVCIVLFRPVIVAYSAFVFADGRRSLSLYPRVELEYEVQ